MSGARSTPRPTRARPRPTSTSSPAGAARRHEPRFTQHGFRYAEISGPERALAGLEAEGRFVHTDVAETGRFSCARPVIRAIHRNVRQGLLSNFMGLPTDCPQRDERQGWLADAHLAAEAAVLNFDMAAFYRKVLRDIRDAQDRQGRIPDFVPPYLVRFAPADPAWGSAYVTLAWLLYWYYGDKATLEEHFEGLQEVRRLSGPERPRPDHRGPGQIRRLVPAGEHRAQESRPGPDLDLVLCPRHRLPGPHRGGAGPAGRSRSAHEQAAAIADAFNARFLRDGQYEVPRSGPVDLLPGQTANALPLWLGIVPAAARKRVFAALTKAVVDDQDCHLDTGILGTRFLLEALSRGGRTDAAFRIVAQTSYPGWGYMIREGATTLWERWEKITSGGMNSHNHIMLGSVDAWLYKHLAGVRCAAPGWKRAVIEPPLLDDCPTARASVAASGGTLSASWERKPGEFRLDVRVPAGTTAEVRIPLLSPKASVEDEAGLVWDGARHRPGPSGTGAAVKAGRLVLKLRGESRRLPRLLIRGRARQSAEMIPTPMVIEAFTCQQWLTEIIRDLRMVPSFPNGHEDCEGLSPIS